MARFEKIVIHFKANTAPGEKKERRVVIRDGGPVRGIILSGPVPPDAKTPVELLPMIEGGLVPAGDGPLVCYMMEDGMVCW